MNKKFISFLKREEVIYYTLTYIGTFLLFLTTLLLMNIFPVEIPLHQLMPAFSAFILIIAKRKKNGVKKFINSFYLRKIPISILLLSILIPVSSSIIIDLIINSVTKNTIIFDFDIVSLWLIISIILGSIGEEIGWRAYLLPVLSDRYGYLKGSIILGLLWGIWHGNYYSEGVGFLLYIVNTVELSLIISWLFKKSNNNLLVTIIFHISINIITLLLGAQLTLMFRIVSCIVFAIPCIVLLLKSPIYKFK